MSLGFLTDCYCHFKLGSATATLPSKACHDPSFYDHSNDTNVKIFSKYLINEELTLCSSQDDLFYSMTQHLMDDVIILHAPTTLIPLNAEGLSSTTVFM